MLLEFRAKNFKTFKDELVFSMIPAPKQQDLKYSLLHEKIGPKKFAGLSSAVIYGPNAAGKTNIIGAIDTLKHIVLRGHIRNEEAARSPHIASHRLELVPCRLNDEPEPVEFAIKFIDGGMLFHYRLVLDLGGFMDIEYSRNIRYEALSVNDQLIFSRGLSETYSPEEPVYEEQDLVHEININAIESLSEKKSAPRFKEIALDLSNNNLHREELFLANGFKVLFSSVLAGRVSSWFEDKLMVVCRADAIQVKPSVNQSKSLMVNKTMNDAIRLFGVYTNDLAYYAPEEDSEPALVSVFGERGSRRRIISAEAFESYGTVRFIYMLPLVLNVLKQGGTLVIDEFDASLHPMVIMSIINIFHNDEVNKAKAQLIFNTHNPIFLNANLFRRDEIKFVERDEETFASVHYALSDFGTSGKQGVRNGSNYMTNYFINQYGAIKDVDFTSIVEDWLASGGDVSDHDETRSKA